jgi:DNA repair protein RadC
MDLSSISCAKAPYVQTPVDAAEAALMAADDPDHEWLMAIMLNHERRMIDAYFIILGATCPLQLQAKVQDILKHASAVPTAAIVSVRYHPHGGIVTNPLTPGLVARYARQCYANGTPLWDHFIRYRDGNQTSFRGACRRGNRERVA